MRFFNRIITCHLSQIPLLPTIYPFKNLKHLKILPLIALMLMSVNGWGQIIISQYYEGSSYDKWIEITNVSNSSVDLSGYYLARWANTSSPSGQATSSNSLSGNLSSGSSVLYKHSSASKPDYASGTDATSVNFNGDDPMAITSGGTDWSDRIDCIYSTGTWGEDRSFYRKSSITTGNTNQSTLDGTGEWEEVSNSIVDNASSGDSEYLGNHVYFNNDDDTEIYDPTSQIAAKTISSLDDTQGEAEDVFTFTIEDQGTDDGLATKVTNIRLTPHTSNTADWTDAIKGVFIDDGSNFIYPTADITDTYIDLAFGASDLNIADGNSKDITICIYLNTSNIIDGSILSFAIDGSNHGFTADGSGSDFSSSLYLGSLNSNDMTINVEASELQFTQQPTEVKVGNAISPSPTIAYTDINGNIDIDYDGTGYEIDLTTTGSFDASVTTSVAPVNGVSVFSDIAFNTSGTGITITGTDNNWSNGSIASTSFDITTVPTTDDIWINEIHYDNDGTDQNEFIEIALVDASNYTLSDFTIYLYNGVNGEKYDSKTLNQFTVGTTYDNTTLYTYNYTNNSSSIQNGDPDGMAISWNDGSTEHLVQFLSYEGTFVATDGPANGQTSIDIGVSESNSTTQVGHSLQLVDNNTKVYSDFVWSGPATATAGTENSTSDGNQTLPIQLLTFTGSGQDGYNLLQWATASEENNDYFTLEKSTDGKAFELVTSIAGAGNSNEIRNYQAKDFNVDAELTYYRLKQTDYDGAYTYSDIISVQRDEALALQMSVLQQGSSLQLNLQNLQQAPLSIKLFDMQGRLVFSRAYQNVNSFKTINLNAGIKEGLYILNVLHDQEFISRKLIF